MTPSRVNASRPKTADARANLKLSIEDVATPLGRMLVVTDDQGRLRALDWKDYENRMFALMQTQYRGSKAVLDTSRTASNVTFSMRAYFNGSITSIDTLDVVTGGTDFQRMVWESLRTIPTGHTISYRALAERIGAPTASRAVGLANSANPIGIVIPCHRAVGSDGSLTGYGGGLERKKWLIEQERKHRYPT